MPTQTLPPKDHVRLLVPIDGSAAANQAVDYAIWCAGAMSNVSILLLNVQNRDTLQLSDILPLTDDEQALRAAAASAEVLHPARERCLAAGVQAECRAAFGPIAATIAQVSRQAKVDLIVMGTHGRSRLGAVVLGSIAAEVLHRVHVPVTLLKQGESSRRNRLRHQYTAPRRYTLEQIVNGLPLWTGACNSSAYNRHSRRSGREPNAIRSTT